MPEILYTDKRPCLPACHCLVSAKHVPRGAPGTTQHIKKALRFTTSMSLSHGHHPGPQPTIQLSMTEGQIAAAPGKGCPCRLDCSDRWDWKQAMPMGDNPPSQVHERHFWLQTKDADSSQAIASAALYVGLVCLCCGVHTDACIAAHGSPGISDLRPQLQLAHQVQCC